jgi:hypothetical protein
LVGLAIIVGAVGLFITGLEAELRAIHARLDQHQALLEAVAILFDLAQQVPLPSP